MRSLLLVAGLLVLPAFLMSALADNPCDDQSVHTYGAGSAVGWRVTVPGEDSAREQTITSPFGRISVHDTNERDCNPVDGLPGDWDGDLDAGIGGGAFGYGAWAEDPECDYGLNLHGPNVAVQDVAFGANVLFVVGEDDQTGPAKILDPVTGRWTCNTDGVITPGNPWEDPSADWDDCLTDPYVGVGATCGTGGGDGLYWVFLYELFLVDGGLWPGGLPTTGTITAF